jgi:hypothetical protein
MRTAKARLNLNFGNAGEISVMLATVLSVVIAGLVPVIHEEAFGRQ